MKINGIFILIIIFGCILIGGCTSRSLTNTTVENPATLPPASSINMTIPQVLTANTPVMEAGSPGSSQGQINISIGNYNGRLPVLIDNYHYGDVSKDNPLSLSLNEGSRTVKVCSGTVCETVVVQIKSAIKTTIDFGEKLNNDFPQGSLNVSVGIFNATLPVYIDNLNAGNASPGKPVLQPISPGYHTVKICSEEDCIEDNFEVTPANMTLVDFGSRLQSSIKMSDLTVSIGGYNAELPVYVDNKSVGIVSLGNPLQTRVMPGVHDVKICIGATCVHEQMIGKFGKQTNIDFGEQLLKSVEASEPTVKILDFDSKGNVMTVNTKFINPSKKDLNMAATVSCVYTYSNYQEKRITTSTRSRIVKSVKSGSSANQTFTLYLYGGDDPLASAPSVMEVTTE